MLESNTFAMTHAQAVIFTPGLQFRMASTLSRLLGSYSDAFDGEPGTMSVPGGLPLPPELPRITLQSQDGRRRLQAGPARLDVILTGDNLEENSQFIEFLLWCMPLFDDYVTHTNARVGRLGCVVSRRAFLQNPAREIAAHFCKQELLDRPLNRPSDFEIHAAKQFLFLEGMEINSWFRCKSALSIRAGGTPQTAVVVEQDFNTRLEESESRNFDADKRRQFFGRAPEGLRQVLELYFPRRG